MQIFFAKNFRKKFLLYSAHNFLKKRIIFYEKDCRLSSLTGTVNKRAENHILRNKNVSIRGKMHKTFANIIFFAYLCSKRHITDNTA